MKEIKEKIKEIIKEAIENSEWKEKLKDIKIEVFPAKEEKFGDFSTNIGFKLTEKGKNPSEIAEKLKERISSSTDLFKNIEVKNGFINFFINDDFYRNFLKKLIEGKEDLSLNTGEGKKILLEFVSANPTGPLTIAHGRQAAYGEALARILKFAGYRVIKEYYINDGGRQMKLLGESLKARYYQMKGKDYPVPEEGYFGEYLIELAKKIKEESENDKFFTEFAYKNLLEEIKKDLSDFGVSFDRWVRESDFVKKGEVEKVIEILKEKGYLYFKDGSWWFKSTEFGDDKDRVVIKSDGSYTYLATDIAYHKNKIDRGYDILINIVGPDHHGYIPRIKAAVQSLGFNPENLKFIIVQLTTLYRGKEKLSMSTRKGQFISLRQLMNEVGSDEAKFFFLFRKAESHLDFDLELAKKKSPENPVYYLQYAYVRMKHVLNFAETKGFDLNNLHLVDFSKLKEEEEIAIMKKIANLKEVIEIASKTFGVHILSDFLLDISKIFHSYYQSNRIVGEDRDLSYCRIALVKGLFIIFEKVLSLLNISLPERM